MLSSIILATFFYSYTPTGPVYTGREWRSTVCAIDINRAKREGLPIGYKFNCPKKAKRTDGMKTDYLSNF